MVDTRRRQYGDYQQLGEGVGHGPPMPNTAKLLYGYRT
jgi:hypothetical protein